MGRKRDAGAISLGALKIDDLCEQISHIAGLPIRFVM